jgi:hypothetical protein
VPPATAAPDNGGASPPITTNHDRPARPDPDRSHRSARSDGHRGDAYHVVPGPGGSLRGGTAYLVEEGPRDALAGAPWVARARAYVRKAGGGLDSALPLPAPLDAAISTVGAFLGILAVAGIDAAIRGGAPEEDAPLPLLIYSFGASAVLLYGVPESKLAQPRNVIGGQVVSAVVGAAVRLALGSRVLWVTAAAGMALALTAMEVLSVVHPPGGATALIASSARRPGPWAGFRLTASVAAGSTVMVAVAVVVNNLHPRTRYPTFWWGGPWPPTLVGAAAKAVRGVRARWWGGGTGGEAVNEGKGGEGAAAAPGARV